MMMKKWSVRCLGLAMAGLMVFSAAACSSGKEPGSSAVSQAENSASEPLENSSSAASQAAPAADGKLNSISDFINSSDFQGQIEALKETMKDQGLNMEVSVEGDKLIYSYQYLEEVETEGLSEMLNAALDTQENTFKMIANSITLAVNVESPIIVVRYLDREGNLLCEREFTAD